VNPLAIILWIILVALYVFVFAMWGRLILDFVQAFIRSWRPRGPLLIIVSFVYAVTDRPLRFVRRFIKPISFGAIALDFGWTVVMLAAIFAISIVGSIRV
jgi:YggT family protein